MAAKLAWKGPSGAEGRPGTNGPAFKKNMSDKEFLNLTSKKLTRANQMWNQQ